MFEKLMGRSAQWMKGCADSLDGLSFPTSNRTRVSASLLHLCVEHQTGVHNLVEHGVIGSAFALLRPQFEAYVRGVWFHRCANDAQIASYLGGTEPPPIDQLLEAIEKLEGYEEGFLLKTKKNVWRNLSDFTHGGSIQVKARNTRDEIVSRYHDEHIVELIESSVVLSLLAGAALAGVAGNENIAHDLWSLYARIYEETP